MDEDDSFDPLLAEVARIPPRDLYRDGKPPAELDEYRLIRPLGRGGMGSVWLAEDTLLDRLVAVKFIARAEPDPRTRERFAIEARAAARLSHSNVVTVHRYGELDGRPYLVSEYIRGDSLDKIAKPIAAERALELGIALARGLAATHRHGIVHRDIKPANAIVAPDGHVKLVDFGLATLPDAGREPGVRAPARALPAAGAELTAPAARVGADFRTLPGAIAGTPLYLPPEVRRGEVADRRSDVYQVGCVLYELVTGRPPVLDLAGGPAAALDEDVPSLAPRVGARFAAVVDRCLRRDPAARFASGDELREALERLAAPVSGGALPEGNPYRGLLVFDAEHRALFFGRGAEIRAVTERLRADPFVLVTGDSGVGKSSLCRAGVLPHVGDGALGGAVAWTIVQMVPGRRPLTTLVSELAPLIAVDELQLADQLRDQPVQLIRDLRRALGAGRGLLVFVDQLEELATLARREEAAAFGHVLGLLTSGAPGLRVLATVRGDFVTRLAEIPGLGDDVARALYVLRPLTVEGVHDAVVAPARATGARFESDELVEALVSAVADGGSPIDPTSEDSRPAGKAVPTPRDPASPIELPLLAFTLSALWDARDPETQTISARSLEAIGGVRGALARHADGVLRALLPAGRTAARQVLLRLVTPERTRARRTADELTEDHAVLDALVRGRLLVARSSDPPTFELAHERLIDGWPALAGWLSDTTAAFAVHRRLTAAAASWEQVERSKDALWHERPLAELAVLAVGKLSASEAAFVAASRRAVRRRRALRIGIAIAIPVAAAAIYSGAWLAARRDVAHRVADNVAAGDRELSRAREASDDSARLQARAFAQFDAGDASGGELTWAEARRRYGEAASAYTHGSHALEAAVLLDTARDDLRRRLAATTFARIELADRGHRHDERAELEARLALYDDGTFERRLAAPGQLVTAIEPAGAAVVIASGATERPLAAGPTELAAGSYVLVASAPGRATVRIPLVIRAGDHRRVALELPPAAAIPAGFVYVPAEPFLYGSRDDEPVRKFFYAEPMHERRTAAFLIGVTEVTYAQWIEFLDDQPAAERERRRPQVAQASSIFKGRLELRDAGGTWELTIAPSTQEYHALAGSPITYLDRTARARQDWRRFPVAGVSANDAQAYAAWLDRTGRVRHARLCSEAEWEHAMRGADGRAYPHGERVEPDDANLDITYGRHDAAFGPDEVASHPASTSPFGLADGSGNLWEVVRSATGFAIRGGSYYQGVPAAHLANREEAVTPMLRQVQIGLRMCADSP